ncbi:MAG: hypothetical protein ACR2JN_00975 [Lapillicoccus sp.]
MKLYADLPVRRTLQLLADLLALSWVGLWCYLGRAVYDATMALRTPADALADAGGSLQRSMGGASQQVGRVPGVGAALQKPFDEAAATGTGIAAVGRDLGLAVDHLALLLGLSTALVPVAIVGGIWLSVRWRFVRRATSAQRFVDADADLDLFALRAMASQPVHRLARITADPAGAWRRREPDLIRALALLELRDSGLRPPPRA